jgi:very-short-patch-repair endonuclease
MSEDQTPPRSPSVRDVTRLPRARQERTASPPPPLAGEGREGACGLSTLTSGEEVKRPRRRISDKMRERARNLRRELTPAERIIGYALRAHPIAGAGFRRQTPIGPYIVDFVSHTKRLVIEIDGGQHFEAVHEARDARRDAFLTSQGFRVLRFSNHDVKTNRRGALEVIAATIDDNTAAEMRGESAAPSLPSPASGGGGARGSRDEHHTRKQRGTDGESELASRSGEGSLP